MALSNTDREDEEHHHHHGHGRPQAGPNIAGVSPGAHLGAEEDDVVAADGGCSGLGGPGGIVPQGVGDHASPSSAADCGQSNTSNISPNHILCTYTKFLATGSDQLLNIAAYNG